MIILVSLATFPGRDGGGVAVLTDGTLVLTADVCAAFVPNQPTVFSHVFCFTS